MKETMIPFCPVPAGKMLGVARKARGIGRFLARLYPSLAEELRQAEIGISAEDYGGILGIVSSLYFLFGFFISYAFATRLFAGSELFAALLGGALLGCFVFVQIMFYPKIMLMKKIRDLERNLVFALRTILVEIKSGVTLFDAINIVAQGDNGEVSREFRKAVENIETGSYQNEALEDIAERNPSLYFRRAIWQLVNGIKAGSDTSVVMQGLVDHLSKEKANQVRKYGNSLKLLSLLYMMLGAIIPALGLTFLIILSTFPRISINEMAFWVLLSMVIGGQFMYLGVIKAARPTLLGD